ncbi:MAG: hypothetical protein WCI89_02015 [bacterium]
MDDLLRAVVQSVVPEGRHGPFAFATSEDERALSVSFSLNQEVWKEEHSPERGSFVMLGQLSRKRAGWRAAYARFLKPTDEQ